MSDHIISNLIEKLNQVINPVENGNTGNDTNQVVCWLSPGTPFDRSTLGFLDRKNVNNEMAEYESYFSLIVDQIPSLDNPLDNSNKSFLYNTNGNGHSLSETYANILNFSKVANYELDEEVKKKLQLAQEKLKPVTQEKEDWDGSTMIEYQDNNFVKRYKEYAAKYENAVLEYNTKLVECTSPDASPAQVKDWSMNGKLYRKRKDAAYDEFVSQGKKIEYEKVSAFIEQTLKRSMTLYKKELEEEFSNMKKIAPNGKEYLPAALYPHSFISSNDGWVKFSHKDDNKTTSEQTQSTSIEGGFTLIKGFKLGADGSYSEEKYEKNIDMSNFQASFSIVQIPIVRPWMSTTFLNSDGWKLDEGHKFDIPAILSTAIFIKDVVLKFDGMHEMYKDVNQKISGGVSFGIGIGPLSIPFGLNAKTSHTNHKEDSNVKLTEDSLVIEGMQLIGFKVDKRQPHVANSQVDTWV